MNNIPITDFKPIWIALNRAFFQAFSGVIISSFILFSPFLIFLKLSGLTLLLSSISMLYVAVTLHELGHILVLRYFNPSAHIIITSSFHTISIYYSHNNPIQYRLISLAGPGLNIVLGFISIIAYILIRNDLLLLSLFINSAIGITNILPTSPDGSVIWNNKLIESI